MIPTREVRKYSRLRHLCCFGLLAFLMVRMPAAGVETDQNPPESNREAAGLVNQPASGNADLSDYFKKQIKSKPWESQHYQNYGAMPFDEKTFFIGMLDFRLESPESMIAFSRKLERLGMGRVLPIPEKYFLKASLADLETLVKPALERGCIILVNTPSPASIYKKPVQKEKVLLLKRLAGRNLLIYSGEADANISRIKYGKLEADATGYYSAKKQFYTAAYDFYRENEVPCFEGTEGTFDDLLLRSGPKGLCCISYGNKMNTELKLAYIRGASRMNDRMLGAYNQIWGGTPNWYPGRAFRYNGPGKIGNMEPWKPAPAGFTTCRRCNAPASQYLLKPFGDEAQFFSCGKCGYAAGKPPEGYRIACLLTLFSGARFFLSEEVVESYVAENYLLPHGAVLQEIRHVWRKMKGKIGDPVTPLAVMTSPDNGWNAPLKYVPKRKWGGNMPLGPAEGMFELYDVFYPASTKINPIQYANVKLGEEGRLSGQKWHDNDLIYPCDFTDTPRGQIDVVTSFITPEKLKLYHSLVVLGPFDPNEETQRLLTDYVNLGGNLLINTRQVGKNPEWIEKLAGIKIRSETRKSARIHVKNPPGLIVEGTEFEVDVIDSGKTDIIAEADGIPVAVFSRAGRGAVSVSTIPYLVNCNNQPVEFGMKLVAAMGDAAEDGITIANPARFEYVLTSSDDTYHLLLIYYGSGEWRGAPWTLSIPGKPSSSKFNAEKETCRVEVDASLLGKIDKVTGLDGEEIQTLSRGDKIMIDVEIGSFNYCILDLHKAR
ncbi:MAG: hypothetical protein PHV34_12280 [Verrucomicrobiae bacterium]|nr:hypothetical protein [Verrucomicrobiae bacterium]